MSESFLENPKKYSDFDFKPLKNTKIAIFRAVLGKWLPFSKNFPKDPKNNKIRILYPKRYDEHTYYFTLEVPPPRGGQYKNHYEQCIKTLKEKRGIPRDQQIRELLSVYHTMTHQPHESVADFTHRFSETQRELDKLIPGIHKAAGKEIELIFATKF